LHLHFKVNLGLVLGEDSRLIIITAHFQACALPAIGDIISLERRDFEINVVQDPKFGFIQELAEKQWLVRQRVWYNDSVTLALNPTDD